MSDAGKRNVKRTTRKKKRAPESDSDSEDSMPEPFKVKEDETPKYNESKLPEELLKCIIKEPGKLLIAGSVSWDLGGKQETNKIKRTHPNLNVFHRFTDVNYRLAVSGCASAHSVLVTDQGKAMTFGRNNAGQLGLGDLVTRDVPEEVVALKDLNILRAATGRNHTLFLTDHGVVYACGDNKSGQCGVGTLTPQLLEPLRIKYTGPPIVNVACGADFSMILDCEGRLYSFGLPEYGQLGHNTDGKFFVKSQKIAFDFETIPRRIVLFVEKKKNGHVQPMGNVEIVDMACGVNHSVAIDSKKRAYSWGFGGFGRLGHADTKDEMVPRLIKVFEIQNRGVCSVFCGSTFSLAINDMGGLFMFGLTKKTGEANMYPKPVRDLDGWNIQSVGTGNTSVMIAADESLIAWGAAPTYGELGLGDFTRSSAKPMEVKRMDGLKVSQVSLGYSHTLLLCDDSTDEAKEKLEQIPEFSPQCKK